jgi:hypothetical protein
MTDDMTTGEADAWRAGWRAAQEAAARAVEARSEAGEDVTPYGLQFLADDIRAMQPPERGGKA